MARRPMDRGPADPGGDHSRRDERWFALADDDLDRIQAVLQQLADEHGRLQGLLEAVLAISAEVELDAVLHTIVDAARDLAQARYGALGVLEGGRFVELITSGHGTDLIADQVGRLPHATGVLGDLVHDPKPLRVDNVTAHPRSMGSPWATPR